LRDRTEGSRAGKSASAASDGGEKLQAGGRLDGAEILPQVRNSVVNGYGRRDYEWRQNDEKNKNALKV
jgi:hypothetical protein